MMARLLQGIPRKRYVQQRYALEFKRSTSELKQILEKKIPEYREMVQQFRSKHGNTKVADITVNAIYGGMRGLYGLVCETSSVDPAEGIRFRGLTIKQCQKVLPKAKGGEQPLPEGLFWLLVTGDVPNQKQVDELSQALVQRGSVPQHVVAVLNSLPKVVHPMTQLSAAVTLMSTESKFKKAYIKGIKKTDYWEYVLEDSLDLIAKLPAVAAMIYKNVYKDASPPTPPDLKLDWGANFTRMLGFDNSEFTELMRLYLSIHSDHEGGNVTAHTTHLVGSALSDPYLSFGAGLNGLAGPLHGLANQEVLLWLNKLSKEVGEAYTEQKLKDFIVKTLKAGQVIPGYGHAVLRKTDPRYTCQREFALKHLPNDPLFKLVSDVFKVVPPILQETGKVQSPWPNVDAHSGVLLVHYGLTEMTYYTVLFGVARSLGVMASLLWDRALGMPIERPKSLTTPDLMKVAEAKKNNLSG